MVQLGSLLKNSWSSASDLQRLKKSSGRKESRTRNISRFMLLGRLSCAVVVGIVCSQLLGCAETVLYKHQSKHFWLKDLADRDSETRLQAVKALAAIQARDEPIIAGLRKLLADKDDDIADAACSALIVLAPESVESLKDALFDKDKSVRIRSAYAFGQLGPLAYSAVHTLTKLIKDSDRTVALGAIRALRDLGTEARSAAPDLRTMLSVEDGELRDAVREALAEMQ